MKQAPTRNARNTRASLLLCGMVAIGATAAWLHPGAQANDVTPADVRSGERLYRDGVLADGRALRGMRIDGIAVSGAAAACVNCHRPSGMGGAQKATC